MSELESPASLCTMWGECNCEYHNTAPLLRSSSTSTICNSPNTDSGLRPAAATAVLLVLSASDWLEITTASMEELILWRFCNFPASAFICFSLLYSHGLVSIKGYTTWVLFCADFRFRVLSLTEDLKVWPPLNSLREPILSSVHQPLPPASTRWMGDTLMLLKFSMLYQTIKIESKENICL